MLGQPATLILSDSNNEAKVSPYVLSLAFWYSWILIHSEGKRLKLTAGTPVVFELCFSWIAMFEAESLGAAVELRGSRTRCIPITLLQLSEREMSPSLISKRTSFGFSQPHLSTLTAVTSCHTVTAAALFSIKTELWVALRLVVNWAQTSHGTTVFTG